MTDSAIAPIRPASRVRPWLVIIAALVIRDFDLRFRSHRPLIALVVFFEPIMLVAGIACLRVYAFGAIPPFGSSFALYFAAGVFPFYIFRTGSTGIRSLKNRSTEFFFVKDFDFLLARFIVQLSQTGFMMLVFFIILYSMGVKEAAPYDPEKFILGIIAMIGLTMGVGLLNCGIRSYFEWWSVIYRFLSRPVMIFSGVFQTVDNLPEPIRTAVSWNPLAHSIELIRLSIYSNYPTASLSPVYLFECCIILLFLGTLMFVNRSVP